MFTKVFTIKARHMFVTGKTLYMCPCKMRPEYAVPVNAAMVEREDGNTSRAELFDRVLAACRYYNCSGETGHTVSCYIKED